MRFLRLHVFESHTHEVQEAHVEGDGRMRRVRYQLPDDKRQVHGFEREALAEDRVRLLGIASDAVNGVMVAHLEVVGMDK